MTPSIIIISANYSNAKAWANDGQLSRHSYMIITSSDDCDKLKGMHLKPDILIAMVRPFPEAERYIMSIIRSYMRGE